MKTYAWITALCCLLSFTATDAQPCIPGLDRVESLMGCISRMPAQKDQGSLTWECSPLKKGKVMAIPAKAGEDELKILSEWSGDTPAAVLMNAHSKGFYDRLQISPLLAKGWDVKVFFAGDSLLRVDRIEMMKNGERYTVYREEGGFFLKVPLSANHSGFISFDPAFKKPSMVYVWDEREEALSYYFPFAYSAGEVEQVFVRSGLDWYELVYSLADGNLEAVAKHEGQPGNIKGLFVKEPGAGTLGVFLQFGQGRRSYAISQGQGFSDAREIRNLISGYIGKISSAHLLLIEQFDIPKAFELRPYPVLRFSRPLPILDTLNSVSAIRPDQG